MLKQLEVDLSYTYQTTSLGLEVRSQDELDRLTTALLDEDTTVVHVHDRHRDITIDIYLRFRERC